MNRLHDIVGIALSRERDVLEESLHRLIRQVSRRKHQTGRDGHSRECEAPACAATVFTNWVSADFVT